MKKPINKPICLVTGSTRGIGKQACISLSQIGYHVIATGRDITVLKSLAKSITSENPEASVEVFELDVNNQIQTKDIRDYLDLKYGRLDLLLNNAGILPSGQNNFLSTSESVFIESFKVNTLGPIHLCQKFIPLLLKSDNPQIINISSGMGSFKEMQAGYPAYRISKTALNVVTKMLHEEFSPQGIRTNSICPGWVKTDMGGSEATRTTEQGVQGILYLARTSKDGPSGKFFRDQKELSW